MLKRIVVLYLFVTELVLLKLFAFSIGNKSINMKVDLAGDFLFKHELKLTNAPYSVYTTYEGNTKISDRDFIIPKFEDIK